MPSDRVRLFEGSIVSIHPQVTVGAKPEAMVMWSRRAFFATTAGVVVLTATCGYMLTEYVRFKIAMNLAAAEFSKATNEFTAKVKPMKNAGKR